MLKNIINSVQAPPPNCLKCSHSKGFKGFTLAEVLITLTIIGVIAALTIPNLMQSYKKHEVEVKVKEAYSILSNAIKMAEAENGPIDNKNYYPHIIEHLKTNIECSSQNPCFDYSINGIHGLDKQSKLVIVSSSKSYVLANGMALLVQNTSYSQPWDYFQINFIVDIDGYRKGKNTIGYDIFIYTLRYGGADPSGHITFKPYFEPGMLFANAELGRGKPYGQGPGLWFDDSMSLYTLKELLGVELYGGCNVNAKTFQLNIPAGARCAAAIAKNGWKIPDDYPVKKW